ncbi:radical SAM protein [Pelomyxa schiedti]|nr:radical SAM protein [Pelomyxa schiedti]
MKAKGSWGGKAPASQTAVKYTPPTYMSSTASTPTTTTTTTSTQSHRSASSAPASTASAASTTAPRGGRGRGTRSGTFTGAFEWAACTASCVTGCKHECRYCYARHDALRRQGITAARWREPVVNWEEVNKPRRLENGSVMFPATHDITPDVLEPCMIVLTKLLQAGNKVLIVLKPHIEVVKVLCAELAQYKENILFRFTIGAMDNTILHYWEPGAPPFEERLESLAYACSSGYNTSVSVVPMLDTANTPALYHALAPHVTDAIWIGKMNKLDDRIRIETEEDRANVEAIRSSQQNAQIVKLYAALKDEPKVKWQANIKEVVGLPLPTQAGTDE